MDEAITPSAGKAPWHLWAVGLVSLAWNAFGGVDYTMTRTRNLTYLEKAMPGTAPQGVLAYIDSFPLWVQLGWGLGVWGAIAGSLLLLIRSRWAVTAFAVSLVGAVFSIGYQMANPPTKFAPPGGFAKIVPVLIIVIAAALYCYARRQRGNGILR